MKGDYMPIGAFHLANLDSTQRKYSLSDKATFWKPADHPLLSTLKQRGRKEKVDDTTFKFFGYPYPTLSGTVYGYSAGSTAALTTTATDIYIASASAFLKPGDLIKVSGYDTNNTETNTVDGEVMRVVSTPATNYATVTRNVGNGSAVANTATTGLSWMFVGNADREGATSRVAKSSAISADTNYIQFFEEPWDVTDVVKLSKYYGPNEKERQKKLALIRIMAGIEHALWYGKKRLLYENSKEQPYTGGMQYWLNLADTDYNPSIAAHSSTTDLVSGNGTSRVWRPGGDFTKPNWLKYIELAFEFGNDTKTGFVGKSFLRQLEHIYGEQIRFGWETTKLGLTIANFDSQGKRIQFVHTPAMDYEDATSMFLVDIDQIAYAYMKDITPRLNIQDNDAQEEKGDYIAYCGLKPEFISAHSYIQNITDVA